MHYLTSVSLVLAVTASALHIPLNARQESICSVVSSKCSNQQAAATSYCASVLSMPVVTRTITPTITVAPKCTATSHPKSAEQQQQQARAVTSEPVCLGTGTSPELASASCSCLSLPTSTATITATTTATVTGPFKLQATAGPAAGLYGAIQYSGFEFIKFNASEASEAVTFELQGDRLAIAGKKPPQIAYELLDDNFGTIFIARTGKTEHNHPISCKMTGPNGCTLSCTGDDWTQNVLCNSFSQWRIGRPHANMAECSKFSPVVVPA